MTPRSFVVKQNTPAITVPNDAKRDERLRVQNIRERIESLERQLRDVSLTFETLRNTSSNDGDDGAVASPLVFDEDYFIVEEDDVSLTLDKLGGSAPTYIPVDTEVLVPENKQMLYTLPIVNDGTLTIDGTLVYLPQGLSGDEYPIEEVFEDQTLDGGFYTVLCDASSAGFTVSLPSAVDCPRATYQIKKIDATANIVLILPDGSETIDGAASISIGTQYEIHTIRSDGSTWWEV